MYIDIDRETETKSGIYIYICQGYYRPSQKQTSGRTYIQGLYGCRTVGRTRTQNNPKSHC